MTYTVLYAKYGSLPEDARRSLMFGETEFISKENLEKTHTPVVKSLMGSKDQIFSALNWSPEKYVDLSKIEETQHTSMSVGDILIDDETGAAYLCAHVGWEQL